MLAEVGAEQVPELLVVNKTDAASEETLLRLKRDWPQAVFVSAHTGAGLDELRAAIEARLPRPRCRWRWSSRTTGVTWWLGSMSGVRCWKPAHELAGTKIVARVDAGLAAALEPYRVRGESA